MFLTRRTQQKTLAIKSPFFLQSLLERSSSENFLMKKLWLALLLVARFACAYAEGGGASNAQNDNGSNNSSNTDICQNDSCLVSRKYVKGAYNAVQEEKIGTTITQQMNGTTITGNVPEGSVVTNVAVTTSTDANNNTETTGLTVTRSNIKIPHNSANGTTVYSSIWLE